MFLSININTNRNRMAEEVVTANSKKCEIGTSEIEFFGSNLTAEGVKIQTAKLNALQDAKQPKTTSEVRSFASCSTVAFEEF
jgi:hypothetical protein